MAIPLVRLVCIELSYLSIMCNNAQTIYIIYFIEIVH